LYMHIYSSFTQIILKAKSTPNASNGEWVNELLYTHSWNVIPQEKGSN
jgi:hypothetical protein